MNAARQSLPISAAVCTLLATLFVTRWHLAPYPVEIPPAVTQAAATAQAAITPLAQAITDFSTTHPWLATACAVIIVGWTLLAIVQLTVKFSPAASRNYLPSQIFLAGAGGIVVASEGLAALTAAWIFALALRQAVFSFHKGFSFPELFHAGFWLGLLPLIYAPAAAIVLPVLIFAIGIFRRSGRELIVALVGLATPVAAATLIHHTMGADWDFVRQELLRCALTPRTADSLANVPRLNWIAATLIASIAAVGAGWALTHKMSIRKMQYKFAQHTFITLLMVAATAALPGTSTMLLAIATVPCALLVPYAFFGRAAGTSTLLYYLMMVAVCALALSPVLL
ncbi:MAG: hypothetical protein LBV38_03915 [Alistipes sp.]|jgi:hypothetical protein|nr:hypothetical protein [Alistipes sp.]